MKMAIRIMLLFFIFISPKIKASSLLTVDETELSGKISDKETGKGLPGVSISVREFKTGTITDDDGTYTLEKLPQLKVLVEIRLQGYKSIIETIDLSSVTSKNFVMIPSLGEDDEPVIVTGTIKPTELKNTSVPTVVATREFIDGNFGANITEAATLLSGVNAVTIGPAISKPVIRGFGFNRTLVMYDGARMENQQWGESFGVETDEFAIDRIEVIKGPASLMYGANAMGGVVNMIPELPVPDGCIKANICTGYQTNNGLRAGSGVITGNTNGFIWNVRGSYKQAKDYQNKYDGRVYGTGFNQTNVSANIGLNRAWGYSHFGISVYDAIIQTPDGSRDSITRKFTKKITEVDTLREIVGENELNSYSTPLLHQHVKHYSFYSSSDFVLGKSKLDIIFAYQQSSRQIFSHPLAPDVPGLSLLLETVTCDLKYHLPVYKGYGITVGVNTLSQANMNNGTEFIVPDYTQFDIGPFVYMEKSFTKLKVSSCLRYDQRYLNYGDLFTRQDSATGISHQVFPPDTANVDNPFQAYRNTLGGVSANACVAYSLSDHFSIKGDLARVFRAPDVFESSSYGIQHGTGVFQLGEITLKPEVWLQEELGLSFISKNISGSLDIYNNTISNYIFNQRLYNIHGHDSVIIPEHKTFQFQSTNAQMSGGEIALDFHPAAVNWLHFDNSLSLVYAVNKGTSDSKVKDDSQYLPLIPPMHTYSGLRIDMVGKIKYISLFQMKISVNYYAAQERAYLLNNTETTTPAYALINVGIGGDICSGQGTKLCSLHISVNNIADVAYQNHLSPLKYMEQYRVESSGRSGIYNMGRNITFKLIIPIDIRKEI